MSYHDDKEALRHICAALSKEFKVTVELNDTKEVAHTDTTAKKVVLGVGRLWDLGLDYHVGLVLHEVAHVRHTPNTYPKYKRSMEHGLLNMIEDERIEELIADEYGGGRYYLNAMHDPAFEELDTLLRRPMPMDSKETIGFMINNSVENALSRAQEASDTKLDGKEVNEIVRKATNHAKTKLLLRTVAVAMLNNKATIRHVDRTGNKYLDLLAQEVQVQLRRARSASADEVPAIVDRTIGILKEIIPDDDPTKPPPDVHGMMQMAGAHETSDEKGREREDNHFVEQDQNARPQVANLKRRLIAKMRENQHQRYEGGKLKGLLDKKRLARTAHHNYRIYRKRLETKGKEYKVALLVDTSGSMFSWEYNSSPAQKMRDAFYSTSLMTRTFRAMGFPTSITLYGRLPFTVLKSSDRYVPEHIQTKAHQEFNDVYHSGDNITHRGIKEALAQLDEGRRDRQKLLVIITDGGLDDDDVEKSRAMLLKAERQGIQTIIFYVEDGTRRLLDNPKNERMIHNSEELIPACVELTKQIVAVA